MPSGGGDDLIVLRRARALRDECYRIAARLPVDERFGMVSQLRRASMSVVLNIAEGNSRLHRAEYIRFLSIARGSAAEVRELILAARTLEFVEREHLAMAWRLSDEVRRMLHGLIASLGRSR